MATKTELRKAIAAMDKAYGALEPLVAAEPDQRDNALRLRCDLREYLEYVERTKDADWWQER